MNLNVDSALNDNEDTALIIAAKHGRFDIVKMLSEEYKVNLI